MKNRFLKRKVARGDQTLRRDLVHAAGCTEPNCCTKRITKEDAEENPTKRTVSVPRSLRGALGRHL